MSKGLIAVVSFTALYVLASIPVALASGNQEFVFYIVVMVVLIAVVYAVHKNVGLTLPTLWALSAWGLMHMAGGLLKVGDDVLYNLWLVPDRLKYDQVTHAYGFGVTTWVCWQALRPRLASVRPLTGPLIICSMAGMGFGALNEVIEFTATRLVEETNVGGYVNTGWDLVSNLVGVVVAAFLIAGHERRPAASSASGVSSSR